MLQRCGGRQCPPGACDHADESLLARSAAGVGPTSVPPVVSEVLASPGRPVEPIVRTELETRFRYDFSQVRVHTDALAATSAQAVDALAYTVGKDIVFGAGRYEPHSPQGRRLLAHELTHVMQQGPLASRPSALRLGAVNDPLEQLADQAAETSAVTVTPAVVPPAVQRQTLADAPPQAAADRAQAHKCLHTPPPPGRLRPVEGERVETLLESRIVTVVEIGAPAWCCPCIDLQLDLDSLCGEFQRDDPKAPIRFFTVDIDDPRNSVADERWGKQGVPRLLIYAGTAERKNLFRVMPSADALKEMLADEIHYVSHSGAATGAKWGLLGGALAGLAGGAIAAMAIGGPIGLLVGLGVLAGGAALGLGGGALIGHLTDRRDRPSAARAGSFEADTLIRKKFGSSLREGPGRLHGARIVPVTKAEIPTLQQCRNPEHPAIAGEAVGWTDFGPDPATVPKSTGSGPTASAAGPQGAEPTCPGRQLEHATPEQPVIYYAVDTDDATLLIHEGLHAYGDPNWRATVGNWRPDEAVTEYFTQEISREIGAPESQSIYEPYVPYVKRLVDRIGESALRDAFFKGDFAPADSVLGNQGLEEWAARLSAGSFTEGDSPDDVLKVKKDYGGGDGVLGPPQAPPASSARPQTKQPSP